MKYSLRYLIMLAAISALGIQTAAAGGHKSKGSQPKSVEAPQQSSADNRGGAEKKSAGEKGPDAARRDAEKQRDQAEQGNERSREMRERSEERKEIQEEYRGEREPGQEGAKTGGKDADGSGKKPWYKFWE